MYHKCGTSVVHKRGLTRFLDDLGIMHLMYVYIHESSEIKFLLFWTLTFDDLSRPNRYVLNDVFTITIPIRLKKAQESCLYIDAWCAPGVQTGTRALIKHGEIGEDSKATPQKVVYQPFAKNQN